jgi:YD repeat-containing protein
MTSDGRKLAVACVLVFGLGCGGQLPGPEGDPAPTTLAGLDEEGLPVVGALPRASGSCTIGSPPYRVVRTASWDAATRTFTIDGLYWKLDERARPVEHGQTDGAWRQLTPRDEHGVLTAFTHEVQGVPDTEKSWAQRNFYDGNGRLTNSQLAFLTGRRLETYGYQYDDNGRLTSVTSLNQEGDQTVEGWTNLYWSNWGSAGTWRLITREQGSGSLVRSRDTRYYGDSGALGRIHFIGGELAADVDGYIDMEGTWAYDAAGRLVRHELDAAQPTDVHIDGVVDSVATFDAACADIAVLPLELYDLESWARLP